MKESPPALASPDLLAKSRGAFFTPPAIANYLARWAVGDKSDATVLDPTCGEGVFLVAAADRLAELGASSHDISARLFGVDLHEESVRSAEAVLRRGGLSAQLVADDFLILPTPDQLGGPVPLVDAVIGNPPYVRYQDFTGEARKRGITAALRQGVQLSGLASSWAPILLHSAGFLKPEGRLAMVLPAELLTVHYAEPVRRWLRRRFASVQLVMFERLQFSDALEKVVLLIAQGSGGCEAFSLHLVEDAEDLSLLSPLDHQHVTPTDEGKWTNILLSTSQRQAFKRALRSGFTSLEEYGRLELGTVTGANKFFTLSEDTRRTFEIRRQDVLPVSPPGTRHLRNLVFSIDDWNRLMREGAKVWLLYPRDGEPGAALRRYLQHGEELGVPAAYKCRIRDPWWRPPAVARPDMFFTYMSHQHPRLISNQASVTIVNSMHGLRFEAEVPAVVKDALPLLALNSVTFLGAELYGRAYGGGILKMEPREASCLPVPGLDLAERLWQDLQAEAAHLQADLAEGRWVQVVKRVDEALLREDIGLSKTGLADLAEAVEILRQRRLDR